jgi:hypothetical protein
VVFRATDMPRRAAPDIDADSDADADSDYITGT